MESCTCMRFHTLKTMYGVHLTVARIRGRRYFLEIESDSPRDDGKMYLTNAFYQGVHIVHYRIWYIFV
jgi:hypothetical protein